VGPDMKPDEGWERQLGSGWDRQVVLEETAKFPKLRPQVHTEPENSWEEYAKKKETQTKNDRLRDMVGLKVACE